METNLAEALGKEIELVDREYAADFAGQSRSTRDVGQMERMIARVAKVLQQIDESLSATASADMRELREAAAQSLNLYQAEREAIVRARSAGPIVDDFAREAAHANFAFARYMRHFAGKDRATRDAAFLAEVVEDLRSIDKRMTQLIEATATAQPEFEKDRSTVRDNLKHYQQEIGLIEAAQTEGTLEQQANVLASLANQQFAVYQLHFAGHPRVSRRPALLARVVTSLKHIRGQMTSAKTQGLTAEFNTKNLAIVEERLATYEKELSEIRKVRQQTPISEILNELGGAANKLFEEYRDAFAGKSRVQVSAPHLSGLCDKLGEIQRQMNDLSRADDSDVHLRNLEVVSDQLAMFETEFEAVTRAQLASSNPS